MRKKRGGFSAASCSSPFGDDDGGDGGLFVGAPWLTELGQLKESGLALKDFALHDPTGELLVVLKTMNMSLRDARLIAERLREELRKRGEAMSELRDRLAAAEASPR